MAKFSWFKTVVLSAVIGGGIAGGVVGVTSAVQYSAENATDGKVAVDGKVVRVVEAGNDDDWFALEYSYEVNGQRYLAVNEDDLYVDIPAFTEDERATIWYDPENPEDAVFSNFPPE